MSTGPCISRTSSKSPQHQSTNKTLEHNINERLEHRSTTTSPPPHDPGTFKLSCAPSRPPEGFLFFSIHHIGALEKSSNRFAPRALA